MENISAQNANSANNQVKPGEATFKQQHRPGELPGQKASPVEQNKKPILDSKIARIDPNLWYVLLVLVFPITYSLDNL